MLRLKKVVLALFLFCFALSFSQEKNSIDVKEFLKIKNSKNTVIIDTRISDAFNGWAMDEMKNGGHIEGAENFSYNWLELDIKDKEKLLEKELVESGITKDKNIILYDSNGEDAKKVLNYLKEKGYNNLKILDLKSWEKSGKKLVKFKNYNMIAPAKIIDEKIKTGDYKVFEVAWGEEKNDKDYLEGHLPGAVHIDTDEIEFPPLWSIVSDEKLVKFAENNGITKESKVILYSTDPMPSHRIAAILQYMGVKEVIVLNGGLPMWTREKLPLEITRNPKTPTKSFGSDRVINKNLIVGIDEAKNAVANPEKSQLINIRSWDEYIGKTSGYADLKYRGRPTGSIFGDSGSDANHLENYRNIDNTMKSGYKIEKRWEKLGVDKNKKLIFFCGSGWRAAEVLVYSRVIGVEDSALYSNGWYEWSSDKNNPVTVGE